MNIADTTGPGIEPIFVSVKQGAQALGISPWTLYQLLDDKKILSRYHGRRRLVDVASLREYAKNLPTESDKDADSEQSA